jgi:hypothetical protein
MYLFEFVFEKEATLFIFVALVTPHVLTFIFL